MQIRNREKSRFLIEDLIIASANLYDYLRWNSTGRSRGPKENSNVESSAKTDSSLASFVLKTLV